MNLFGLMETSGGAMQAERMRAEVVAANMANAETTRTAAGGPYRRQHVVFAANRGDSGFLDAMPRLRRPARISGFRLDGCRFTVSGPCPCSIPVDPTAGAWRAYRAGGRGSRPSLNRYDPGHPDAGTGWICLVSGH